MFSMFLLCDPQGPKVEMKLVKLVTACTYIHALPIIIIIIVVVIINAVGQ